MEVIYSANLASLSPHCRSVLLGSVLGDASLKLTRNGDLACFRETHADGQREYLHWKAAMMPELSAHVTASGCLSIDSCHLLTDLRRGFYTADGVKNAIPVAVVAPYVDDLLLLTWYLDDGGVTGQRGYTPRISSALPRKDLDLLLSDANERLGLHLRISTHHDARPNRKPMHSIYIPTADQRQLFSRWFDLSSHFNLPDAMLYKLTPVLNKGQRASLLSAEEDAVIREHAGTMCAEDIAKLLPGRDPGTISRYAKRHGIVLKDGRPTRWTVEQEEIVKELYPDTNISLDAIADRVGRTAISVKGKAVALGLRRG